MATLRPATLAALNSLAAFGVLDRAAALDLLACWARRGELTPADLADIAAHLDAVPARVLAGGAR